MMKTPLLHVVLVSLAFNAVESAFAQQQSVVFVSKERRFVQTGPGTTVPRVDGGPFQFIVEVQGNVTPPVAFTAPGAAARSITQDGNSWRFHQEFPSQAAMDATFPNGNYTVTFSGRTATIAVTGDLYPATPVGTFSQGAITNGTLVIDRTQPLAVTTSFPQNFLAGRSRLGINIFGGTTGPTFVDMGGDNGNFDQTPFTFTFPANTLAAGVNYTIEMEANRLTTLDTTTVPGFIIAGGFSAFTTMPVGTTAGPATPIAPAITSQPRGATVNTGSTVALTVAATGSPAPSYQWLKDGSPIVGATSDTLLLSNISAANAGNYSVVVTNSAGTITSGTATIAVVVNQPSRLPNLSVRTNLGASQTLIVGFSTVGSKTMLVRAIGPTLTTFGVGGVLADPAIEVYNAAAVKIDENNDWNGSLTTVFGDLGAFALVAGSKDAALQRSISGANTAQIRGPGSGVVLVEVYDGGGTGKLTNVSARNIVGTGENILIAGFVVDGTAAKTLLIRGVGAKLAEFGVSRVLADPKLEIYNSAGVKIAENDNWNSLLQPIAQGVGAFALTPGSADAALVMTIAPGAYTAQISGVGGTTGEALVEVYEVP